MFVGRLVGAALMVVGLLAGLAIFIGSFSGRFPGGLARTWVVAIFAYGLGVLLRSTCSPRAEPERTARAAGMGLLALGFLSVGALCLNAAGGMSVRNPVQLWLLFAVCALFGGLATLTSRL